MTTGSILIEEDVNVHSPKYLVDGFKFHDQILMQKHSPHTKNVDSAHEYTYDCCINGAMTGLQSPVDVVM